VSLVLSAYPATATALPEWIPPDLVGHVIVAATLDGIPAGVLALTAQGDRARITYYWVVPELRGLGIGQELIARALEEAHVLGARAVEADIAPGDRGAKLAYEALGFRTIRLTVRKELTS